MRHIKLVAAILVSIFLASCGGGGGDLPAKPKFTSQVSFGDSLSDVGSYKVGLVAALGGGQFTINIPGVNTNWTEYTAAALGLPAPCAAETGLDNGSGAAPGTPAGTVIPVTDISTCTGYAQGGARVTNPVGVGNRFIPVVAPAVPGFALTVPVVTQISHHLANTTAAPGGKFTGSELVLVMAGANDVFLQSGSVGASYPAASAVAAMQTAATELAADVNSMVTNGAKYVVVANIPAIASTPYVTSIANVTAQAQTAGLMDALVTAFNATLKAALPDSVNVLNVDAYSASKDEVLNASKYNLTNVTVTACNLTNPLASSLGCNPTNLTTGVLPGDHYLFADYVHPTPYGHSLFATYVMQAMTNKGWY